ncbi:putative transcriptional regulatory protein TcrX [Acidithrix ferrooxidans]|uniref:Putative transcriptional regulatory protein TcrX n=1 Tax=Acidithrix ferrooxidans TaxID=1280514 RepID=A0A0D8HJ94_9ACTN|nr:putative transcriptional regulatory protein TcrX [Acidithrix ferrooxidans]
MTNLIPKVSTSREPKLSEPTTAPRVLVIDDESSITDLVSLALGFQGYKVEKASGAREGLEKVRSFSPDIILLDVMMPELDGFEVARRLRMEKIDTPIIFLTAKDTTEDKVSGLKIGGDDYVTKPFSLEELAARVDAIIRRTKKDNEISTRLVFADLILDLETHEVFRKGQQVELTSTEFNLLQYLMENARRVVSKSQILDHVWHYDFGGDANIVETYISYLRRKIDSDSEPSLIRTVRGAGYSMRMPNSYDAQ